MFKKEGFTGGAIGREAEWDNPEFVHDEITKNGNTMVHVFPSIAKEYQFAMKWVSLEGRAFEHVPETLRGERSVLMNALGHYGHAFKHAPEELKNDREVVLAAVKDAGGALEHAVNFQGDKEVVLAALKKDGSALQWAAADLRSDPEVVLAAVSKHSHALQFASPELRGNREVVVAAVTQSRRELYNEFEKLKFTPKFHPLQIVSPEMRSDYDVMLLAAGLNGLALQYTTEELRGNYDIVLAAVKSNGLALEYASEDLRRNYDIVFYAVRENGNALRYAKGSKLKKDEELIRISKRLPWFKARISGKRLNCPGVQYLDREWVERRTIMELKNTRRSQAQAQLLAAREMIKSPIPDTPVRVFPEAVMRLAEEMHITEELGHGDKRSAVDIADETKLVMDGEELVDKGPPISLEHPLEDLVNDPRLITKYVEVSLRREIPEGADPNFGIGVIIVKCLTLREKQAEEAARGPPTAKDLNEQVKKAKASMLEHQRNGNTDQAVTELAKVQALQKRRDEVYAQEIADEKRRVEEEKERKRLSIIREKEEAEAAARKDIEAKLAEKRARQGLLEG